MKNFAYIAVASLLLSWGCGSPECGCNPAVSDTKWVMKLHFVDGTYKTDTFLLPSTSQFWIQPGQEGEKGTYTLKYIPTSGGNHIVLKPAVIDYDVLSTFKLDTASKQVELVH